MPSGQQTSSRHRHAACLGGGKETRLRITRSAGEPLVWSPRHWGSRSSSLGLDFIRKRPPAILARKRSSARPQLARGESSGWYSCNRVWDISGHHRLWPAAPRLSAGGQKSFGQQAVPLGDPLV